MIADLMNLLFEPNYPRRYIGRHRAPLALRGIAAGPVVARVRAVTPVQPAQKIAS
jgi:hypothetical protein